MYRGVDTLMTALLRSVRLLTPMRKLSEAACGPVRRILLIDDNRDGLAARKAVLEGEGHFVLACNAPEEALRHFSEGEFHLVVTDYRMPGMNGTELIRALRELRAQTLIVLVSGMVEVLGLNERNTGADAVIAKNDMEVATMVRTVNRLLKAPRKPVKSARPRSSTSRKTG